MSAAPETESDVVEPRSKPAFLRRVRIRNYKSIAFCDVSLEPLTILVGRNASGKSNFLDALAFLRDLLVGGAHEATKQHGGGDAIVWRYADRRVVRIEIECAFPASPRLDDWTISIDEPWTGELAVDIAYEPGKAPRVVCERARLTSLFDGRSTTFTASDGRVSWEGDPIFVGPEVWNHPERLLLPVLGWSPFDDLFDGLLGFTNYSFNPDVMRTPQRPTPGEFLERDGRNLASVLRETSAVEPRAVRRASQFLEVIARPIQYADVVGIGGYEITRFHANGEGPLAPILLDAASMSDGTLRAFAALVAVYQKVEGHGYPHLVAIEEPETSLHPAATNALVGALDEGTLRTQILLTTHSGEMLDNPTIGTRNVRVVQLIDGRSVIAPVDEASVEIVKQRWNTLGGLERENQLQPDFDDRERQDTLSHSRNGSS